MQGSRSHPHSLLLAEALPSSVECLLAPRPLQINILAFGGCLAVPETPGPEFAGLALACAGTGSAIFGRSIPWYDHRACGCCVKPPKALLFTDGSLKCCPCRSCRASPLVLAELTKPQEHLAAPEGVRHKYCHTQRSRIHLENLGRARPQGHTEIQHRG